MADYEKYQGVTLTEQGEAFATRVAWRYCVVSAFFDSVLDTDLDQQAALDIAFTLSKDSLFGLRDLVNSPRLSLCPVSNGKYRVHDLISSLVGICSQQRFLIVSPQLDLMDLGLPKSGRCMDSYQYIHVASPEVRQVIRDHVHHIHDVIDSRSLPIRGAITVVALLSLPIVGTAVRTLGSMLDLDQLILPLLVLAHVPVVIALIAVWSIGCDICRTEGTA